MDHLSPKRSKTFRTAAILTGDGHENKTYDITHEETVTIGEVAGIIFEITGRPITYVSPAKEEYIKTLTEAGVPEGYAAVYAGFAEGFKQDEFDQTGSTMETLLGRKPISVRSYLETVYSGKN